MPTRSFGGLLETGIFYLIFKTPARGSAIVKEYVGMIGHDLQPDAFMEGRLKSWLSRVAKATRLSWTLVLRGAYGSRRAVLFFDYFNHYL